MKKLSVFITVVLCCVFASAQSPCPTTATIDGVAYDVVQVGSQCWTASNMRNTHYADGVDVEPIPMLFNTSSEPSVDATRYGYLYTPAAATRTWSVVDNEIQGICPEGWRIPTQADLLALLAEVSVEQLMASEDWLPRDGSNTLGFNLLPAGIYNGAHNSFENYRITTMLLTAEPSGTMVYHPCKFGSMCGTWEFIPGKDGNGYSVRCVRDAEAPAAMSVTTDSATAVTNSGAKLYGNVTSLGDNAQVTAGFRYGQHPDYMAFKVENTAFFTGSYNVELTGISPNTTYYFQAYAATATDTVWAADTLTFTTLTNPCQGTAKGNEHASSNGIDSVRDSKGNSYLTVQIGSQCWMAQNLRTETVLGSYNPSTEEERYDVENYGLLYTWDTAAIICPQGWHLPSNTEWNTLSATAGVGMSDGGTGSGKLAGGCIWNDNYDGAPTGAGNYLYPLRDSTGFSALPTGAYYTGFHSFGGATQFWCANLGTSAGNAECYIMYNGNEYNYIQEEQTENLISVRCVRDAEAPAAMSVTTDSANTVTKNGATLYGNVTSLGTYDQVNAGFKYGTSEDALTTIVTDGYAMWGSGRFNFNITGLTANTQYYYKAFAANGSDTVYGEVKDFTTAADIVTDTIAFLPNGGQDAMDTMLVNRGNTALNANTYTHDGNWEFLGWNTEADGAGTHYDNQAALTTNGNLTLYAQWHTYCTGTPQANESGTSRIDSVKDVDNNQYAVVQIGNQCWMKQNLRTTTNTANTGNIYTPETPGYNVNTYGRLYDWAAVMQGESSTNYPAAGQVKVQGICPTGWHVPSDAEWDTLTYYVYNSTDPDYKCSGCSSSGWEKDTKCIAKALASTTGWKTASTSGTCRVCDTLSRNNATGFSALPAGGINFPNDQPTHTFFSTLASFSSATDETADSFYTRTLQNSYSKVGSYSNIQKKMGFSVRCVRD